MKCLARFALWLVAVAAIGSAYPMYGPKRYRAYTPFGLVYPARAPYAPAYPYGQELSELYGQEPYDTRYRFVQVPFYFPAETPAAPYYYDDEEPAVDEAEEQEAVDPYGQDWYAPGQDWYQQDANAKANAYFLQNLILAEMYKDAQAKQQQQAQLQEAPTRYPVTYGYPSRDEAYPADYEDFVYGEQVPKESADEDVSQLKSLVVAESSKRQQLKKKIQESKSRFADNTWSDDKRNGEKKGQDEVVLPRPATPLRTPVFHQRSHEPSPYDAIKKLLSVQSQQKSNGNRQPQKRSYIPNEDALVEQLGNLKKSA